jgi:hypothetical protein
MRGKQLKCAIYRYTVGMRGKQFKERRRESTDCTRSFILFVAVYPSLFGERPLPGGGLPRDPCPHFQIPSGGGETATTGCCSPPVDEQSSREDCPEDAPRPSSASSSATERGPVGGLACRGRTTLDLRRARSLVQARATGASNLRVGSFCQAPPHLLEAQVSKAPLRRAGCSHLLGGQSQQELHLWTRTYRPLLGNPCSLACLRHSCVRFLRPGGAVLARGYGGKGRQRRSATRET